MQLRDLNQPGARSPDAPQELQRAQGTGENATALTARAAAADERLRALTVEKQLCAKAFGPAKRRGDDLAPLKLRMQDIGAAWVRAESDRDSATKELRVLLTPTNAAPVHDAPVHDAPVHDKTERDHEPAPAVPPTYSSPVRIAALQDDGRADWQAYVDQHPRATLYHDVRWRDTIRNSFGHATNYLIARDGESATVCGVLPLVRQRSLLFGDFLTSLPFVNYGGALADSAAIELTLMDAAGQLGARLGVRHVEFRDTSLRAGWPCRDDKVAMHLTLPEDPQALLAGLGSKLRAQIRRPQRDGATVELRSGTTGTLAVLDEFYAVFAHNMRDLGTPVYAKRWFAAICRAFADQVAISIARVGGRAVGAGFLVRHRATMEIPWASTLRSTNSSGINMLLYWHHLEHAIRQGCRVFDFGRSTRDSGTFRFKQQWGAQPTPLYWHYWLPDGGEPPHLNPDNPRYKLAIAAWRRLPVWTTKMLGPPIVRSLP